MSIVAARRIERGGRARAEVRAGFGMARARLALAVAYSAYVALLVPAIAVPVLALFGGLAALLVFDARARPAWCASHGIVLAVLHARTLAPEASFVEIQLGLAAFAAASCTLSLIASNGRARLALVVALAALIGLLLGLAAGLEPTPGVLVSAVLGGAFAGVRPLSALALIATGRCDDRWLAWQPLVAVERGAHRTSADRGGGR